MRKTRMTSDKALEDANYATCEIHGILANDAYYSNREGSEHSIMAPGCIGRKIWRADDVLQRMMAVQLGQFDKCTDTGQHWDGHEPIFPRMKEYNRKNHDMDHPDVRMAYYQDAKAIDFAEAFRFEIINSIPDIPKEHKTICQKIIKKLERIEDLLIQAEKLRDDEQAERLQTLAEHAGFACP